MFTVKAGAIGDLPDSCDRINIPCKSEVVYEWESEAAMLRHLESVYVQEAFGERESLIASPLEIRRYTLVM